MTTTSTTQPATLSEDIRKHFNDYQWSLVESLIAREATKAGIHIGMEPVNLTLRVGDSEPLMMDTPQLYVAAAPKGE